MARGSGPEKPASDQSTATVTRPAPPPEPLGAVLRVLDAPAAPASFVLKQGRCTVGSSASCDIVIDEPTVSRAHLELGLVPEGVSVTDLGSRNGTFYLGQRIEKMVLAYGGRLSVGGATLAIQVDAAELGDGLSYAHDAYRGLVGVSPSMRRIFAILSRLEGSLVTVLVEGESGVGKELIAQALHEGSAVATGPLIAVNCGAVARELVASELFGHKRGAFTGAVEARRGAFESADGGTLFLDELGELPLEVQPMLLRALETGEVRALGGDDIQRVKVRVVAATNRDLEAEVSGGRFREDLFYRLAVVRIYVPPLRERPGDLEALAQRFADQLGLDALPPPVMSELKSRPWPGNARELRNAIQAYGALGVLVQSGRAPTALLDLALGQLVDVKRPYAAQKDELFERFTRIYLAALLAHTGGNRSLAAELSGLDRTYVGKLLAKHGLPRGG